ncbi:ThuA domain-containing protein [Roseivirga pacifica]|uniref:ThuA domain-containing protein n=1 Tax=Roseivirga pacifica TaxID=1267423 RepID=UPI00227A66CB|nr:ThuA domain-containing protein [Roseivirga pacifica]
MKSRRSFLGKATLLAGSVLLGKAFPEVESKTENPKPLPSLSGRKVLFTYGGWPGHEPEKFKDYMVPWLEGEGATVVSSSNLEPYADADFMKEIDLVIQCVTMSSITTEQEQGLLAAIKAGTGMAGWHGGMCDSFRNNPEYQYMTGGQWVAHPGGILDYSVQISQHNDAVTDSLNDFKIKSEQYYMHIDPNVKVLATTKFNGNANDWIDGCVMPVAWKKTYGKGRVFYSALGHSLQHLADTPAALTMIKRGIHWASASKYEAPENWVNPVYEQ